MRRAWIVRPGRRHLATPSRPVVAASLESQSAAGGGPRRTLSLSVLLQWATAPPQEVASIRTEFLRQYRVLGRFSTVRSENQRTPTVCPVHSQKNDFQIWCPFWCPLLNRKWPSKWLIFPIVRHEKEAFLP